MFSEKMIGEYVLAPVLIIAFIAFLVGALSMKGCEYIGDHYSVKIEKKP